MKKVNLVIMGLIVAGGTLFIASRVMAKNNNPKNNILVTATPIPENKLHSIINNSLSITLPNKNLKKLTYTLDSADLSSEIIVNGQRIQSVVGKIFLVINLKITNDNQQGVQINSRDFVRLAAPGTTTEWWAPEIYNDPVEVQAISTKLSRLGFTVDSKLREFKLRVGEVGGEKRDVIVKF